MTPEFQTMMNQLAEIVKGMQPPSLPDQPTREMVDSLTQAHQAQMQARQGESLVFWNFISCRWFSR